MKTKTMDVWVRPDELTSNGISCQTACHSHWTLKAKLIVEIPEKKVEIAEGELEDILKMTCKIASDNERILSNSSILVLKRMAGFKV